MLSLKNWGVISTKYQTSMLYCMSQKLRQKAEATIHLAGADIVANAEHDDMCAAIDLLIDKLDHQSIKHKEKSLARAQGH